MERQEALSVLNEYKAKPAWKKHVENMGETEAEEEFERMVGVVLPAIMAENKVAASIAMSLFR